MLQHITARIGYPIAVTSVHLALRASGPSTVSTETERKRPATASPSSSSTTPASTASHSARTHFIALLSHLARGTETCPPHRSTHAIVHLIHVHHAYTPLVLRLFRTRPPRMCPIVDSQIACACPQVVPLSAPAGVCHRSRPRILPRCWCVSGRMGRRSYLSDCRSAHPDLRTSFRCSAQAPSTNRRQNPGLAHPAHSVAAVGYTSLYVHALRIQPAWRA